MNFKGGILFFFLSMVGLWAQELPPIQNFYPSDYHGENQNWAISQSSDKIIYVANSEGLLQFNGAQWKLYPSPNESIMRSVKVVGDRIYTGCYMEFGYWQKNDVGTLDYTSLSRKIELDPIVDEEFWNIISIEEYIIFQSLRRIYIYNVESDTASMIESENVITKMFQVGQDIYFQRIGEGLFKIESGKDFLVFEDAIVKNDEVIQLFGTEKNLLVLTQNNGFFRQQKEVLVEADNFPNTFLSRLNLYDGLRLADNSFALGSISNGLIQLDAEGKLVAQINQKNGLSNNTVLALSEDIDKNIWLGLDHGVSYINTNSPYQVFNDNIGALGSVYASAIHNGDLYLGTNQGLFFKKLDSEENFKLVNNTQGQVWCLEVIGGDLFCGHHLGTFLVNGGSVDKIANVQGTWNLAELQGQPNLMLQGNYDGLYVLEKTDASWGLRNKIEGFDNSSRYFETLGNQIFVNHEYNGVFRLEVNDSFTTMQNLVKDTLIRGSNSGIVKYGEDLLYAYKKGILKYDSDKRGFQKDSLLSSIYDQDEYESGKLIVDKVDNKLWSFNQSNISFVAHGGLTDSKKIKRIPLTKEMREGILEYENILKLDEGENYLFGKTSGYITIAVDKIKAKSFEVHIDNISIKNGINGEKGLNTAERGNLSSSENNLSFSYYTPEYNKFVSTQYQHRLKGISEYWSDWSESSSIFHENLPYGNYVFEVRSKIGDTVSKNMASYTFKIGRPWYISNLMLMVYLLALGAFSWFMHTMYKQYYKKQRLKLIEKNERELKLAQVENEKEIIRIKNDQLKQENKNKSKELAASTMSIIKKNELLTNIKDELIAISDKNAVKPVIDIIDKSLKKNDDWEMFQEAFNNVDSKFFKKVKKAHPSLSPNDLKLCAYLRLNLSSKEIAQLLHISPRSVEIKRYRLRKKLKLEHEHNLVNYILGL